MDYLLSREKPIPLALLRKSLEDDRSGDNREIVITSLLLRQYQIFRNDVINWLALFNS